MEEEYYINWWDDSYHLDRKRKEEDTKHQIVNEFLIHLKNLISSSDIKFPSSAIRICASYPGVFKVSTYLGS